MFIIKFTTGDLSGVTHIVHHAYAYSVSLPEDCDKEPPMVHLALKPDSDVYDHHQTDNFVVMDHAFIMNESGKTIEIIRNESKKEPR